MIMTWQSDTGFFIPIIGQLLAGAPERLCRRVVFVGPDAAPGPNVRAERDCLIFLLDGSQRVGWVNGEYCHVPGEVLYLNCKSDYSLYWDLPCRRFGMMIYEQYIVLSWNDNPGGGRYVREPDILTGQRVLAHQDFFHLFSVLTARSGAAPDDPVNRMIPELLLRLLLEILREPEREPGFSLARFHRVVAYVDEHYSQPLSRKSTAEHFGISDGHLGRLFHQHAKMGFSAYLTMRRMRAARELLSREPLTVREVAARCGFKDDSYFIKAFQRYWNIRPGEFSAAERNQ